MSATVTVPPGAALCHLPAAFQLARGGELAGGVLAFERLGPSDAPVVAVLGGISAGRHPCAHAASARRGWWDGIVGAGAAIDTERFQVLSFDWLGGAGSSTAPAAGEPFPFVDAADQAAALWHLCDALRLPKLHAIIGCSYGGMVALHAAAQAPARVARLGCIAAAHRSHPQASAFRAVQRGIVELGVRTGAVRESLALARALALTTYRTPGELQQRFAGAPNFGGDGSVRLPVQDWLDARGAEFAAHWGAEQFLCLNRSLDAHRIEPAQVTVPTWLLAFVGDQLVPPSEVRELALALPQLRAHRELRSRFGHDAFLKEPVLTGTFVREVLS
jgi:homoserine O-acetyltransferase/O-succinyltransferase